MQRMITSVVVSVLLGGFAVAAAQLPPDIMADAYLLRAEQAVRDGNQARAHAAIDNILDLQNKYELDVPDDFHFRYAKAADSVDLPEQALEAVVRYLAAAGRAGLHYVEALELMNKAQDEIAGRQDSQAASPEQPLPTQPAVDFGDDNSTLSSQAGVAAASCEAWNTEEYFRAATAEGVTACLDAGADPKAQDKDKWTPLHYAAKFNENPAVIEVLLAADAELEKKADGGYRPLHLAALFNGNPAVVQTLIDAGAELRPSAGVWRNTPLRLAALFNGNPAVVQTLIDAGAELNDGTAGTGKTALHWAAKFNKNPAVIETLLKAGADLEKMDDDGNTPLHMAAQSNGNPAIIQALIDAGANLEANSNFNHQRPLHLAAWFNENPAIVQTLIDAGAELEAGDDDRRTPLYWAADSDHKNDNPEVAKVLRDAGATRMRTERQRASQQQGNGFGRGLVALLGGTAIAVAGGGTDEAVAAGGVFAEGVLSGNPPAGNSGGGFDPVVSSPAGNTGITAGGGSCQVPNYPSPPGGVANLGFSWCPASVGMQRRSFALQAAGAQCAIATGSSSTPEQINARRQEINAACDRLDAMQSPDIPTCQCPAGLRR